MWDFTGGWSKSRELQYLCLCGESIFKARTKYDFAHSLREASKSYAFPGVCWECPVLQTSFPRASPSGWHRPHPVAGLAPASAPLVSAPGLGDSP